MSQVKKQQEMVSLVAQMQQMLITLKALLIELVPEAAPLVNLDH